MIKLKNFSKSFKDKEIFHDVNIAFQEDKIYAVLGDSGAGKTTLFQILFGLDNNYSGEYVLFGKNAKDFSHEEWNYLRSSMIQIVYQDFKLLEELTAFDNLYYACNEINAASIQTCKQLLTEMQLDGCAEKKVKQLSGGEKQRLAFARSLVNSPSIILLDEPTGNLDDNNATIILNYIQKLHHKGVMIIIITHDSRVIPYCDSVYRIKNKQISSENQTIEEKHSTLVKYSTKKYQHPSLKYTLSSMKHNLGDILLSNLPIMTLFIVFIVIFSFLWSSTINSLDKFYNGLSPDGIYISSSTYTDDYVNDFVNKDMTPMDDGERIYFSNKDLEKVKSIQGVKDATLCDIETISIDDLEEYTLQYILKKDELGESIKAQPSYSNFPSRIELNFESINIPKDYISIYNPKAIEIVYGDYPKDNTEELLIPDFYALTLSDDIDSIIGSSIKLDVLDDDLQTVKKSYTVAGVYKSNYENSISNVAVFYLGYRNRTADVFNLMTSDEGYQHSKNAYLKENGSLDHTLYVTKERYIQAIGTGKGDLLIKLTNQSASSEVSKELKELFPNLKLLSKSEMEQGEFKASYNSLWKVILCISATIALLFGTIIIFLHRNYIKKRNKELSILYSLGYSKFDVYKVLLYEYAITNIMNFLIAYILIAIFHYFFFQYSSYYTIMSNVFTLVVFTITFVFVILMTLLSIIFSIRGIKQNNLQKYLR